MFFFISVFVTAIAPSIAMNAADSLRKAVGLRPLRQFSLKDCTRTCPSGKGHMQEMCKAGCSYLKTQVKTCVKGLAGCLETECRKLKSRSFSFFPDAALKTCEFRLEETAKLDEPQGRSWTGGGSKFNLKFCKSACNGIKTEVSVLGNLFTEDPTKKLCSAACTYFQQIFASCTNRNGHSLT